MAPWSGTSLLQSISVIQATQFVVHFLAAPPTNTPVQECFTIICLSLVTSFLCHLEQIMVTSMSKFLLRAIPHLCPFLHCPWRMIEAHFRVHCASWKSNPLPFQPQRVLILLIVFLELVWSLGSGQLWQFKSTWLFLPILLRFSFTLSVF